MSIVAPTYPSGKVIFCDDIRSEVGNKISLVGIYLNSLLIPAGTQFPITLAKFGIAVFWNEPIDGYSEQVTFKADFVPLDAKPTDEGTFLAEVTHSLNEAFQSLPMPSYINDESKPWACRQTIGLMMISPFTIPHPGKVRVRAHRATDVRAVGATRIELQEQSDR